MPRSTGTQTRTFAYHSTTQFLGSATNPENGTISYATTPTAPCPPKRTITATTRKYSYDAYQRVSEIQGFVYNGPQNYTEDTTERQTFTWRVYRG
ncbi:MAG TPA: hypothetical protein VN924_01440 [Bryobacteraceae bacterium]|jgi:hypothetical protein|nr:hypothetical protein [Bryobacteraceae bacterium]